MTAAVSLQIIDRIDLWDTDVESIELSDCQNDLEEEEEDILECDFVLHRNKFVCANSALTLQPAFGSESNDFLTVYFKIPLPPPELA